MFYIYMTLQHAKGLKFKKEAVGRYIFYIGDYGKRPKDSFGLKLKSHKDQSFLCLNTHIYACTISFSPHKFLLKVCQLLPQVHI